MEEEAPRIGAVLSNAYRIIDTIAIGGSGTVYRAEQLESGEAVAVKLMHSEHPEGDRERQRFYREAEIIKQLAHQHVVRMLDYGHSDDDLPFLVFPLLEGRTLKERILDEGPLGWTEIGRLSIQVLSALERAHRAGIVHRDMKPANLFLCKSPVGESVKIIDFGLARDVQVSAGAELTRVGAVLGTPRYMAPEQVRGEPVGQTADIYAFGLVMSEMLLGHPLVTARAELDVYMVHGADKPLDLPIDVLRSPFAAVIRRAVAKPLEVRYRSAGQMLADLRAVTDLMNKDRMLIASPDMEATQVMAAHAALPIQGQTQLSEELRSVFNAMMDRDDEEAPLTPHFSMEHAPPTLKRAVGDGPPTLQRAVVGGDDPSDELPVVSVVGHEALGHDPEGEGPATLVERSDDGRATLVDEEEHDGRHTLVDEEEGEARATLVDSAEAHRETSVDPGAGADGTGGSDGALADRLARAGATPSEEPPPPTLMSPHLDGPPTLPRAVPESTDSVPLLLTREPLDEQETVRIKVTKEQAARLAAQVPLPRVPFESDGPTLPKVRPISDDADEEPVPPTVASSPEPALPVAPQPAAVPPAGPAPLQPLADSYDPASLQLIGEPGQRRFPLGLVLLVVAALAVVLLFVLTHTGG